MPCLELERSGRFRTRRSHFYARPHCDTAAIGKRAPWRRCKGTVGSRIGAEAGSRDFFPATPPCPKRPGNGQATLLKAPFEDHVQHLEGSHKREGHDGVDGRCTVKRGKVLLRDHFYLASVATARKLEHWRIVLALKPIVVLCQKIEKPDFIVQFGREASYFGRWPFLSLPASI